MHASVMGFVVLVKGKGSLQITDERNNRVFGLTEDLKRAICDYKFVYGNSADLSPNQIEKITEILTHQHVDPQSELIGNYRLVKEIKPGITTALYEGQHTKVQNRKVYIKRFRIPAIQSSQQLYENIRQFKQAMEALSQLEGHPNIVRVYDFMTDPDTDDTYWLFLEFVDSPTLQNLIERKIEFNFCDQMTILGQVADALSYCHQQNIIHRNLTPQAIFISSRNFVKVSDFDFARVPLLGYTISHTNKPLVVNKYIAPEQMADPRSADFRADLYSLGAVWYDMIFQTGLDDPILASRISQSAIPSEGQNLLKSLLSERPCNRPKNASEVKEWFDLLRP